jgi:hypothetical protein
VKGIVKGWDSANEEEWKEISQLPKDLDLKVTRKRVIQFLILMMFLSVVASYLVWKVLDMLGVPLLLLSYLLLSLLLVIYRVFPMSAASMIADIEREQKKAKGL